MAKIVLWVKNMVSLCTSQKAGGKYFKLGIIVQSIITNIKPTL